MGSRVTLNDFFTCALEFSERTSENRPRNMEAYHDHAIPELPTEIIFTHILPRLPPKDLMMRCTCELGQYYPDVQSVHGLICGSSSFQPEFFILNPSTREYIELPHAKERPVNHYAHQAYHFGFSPLTNEYKVLQVLSFRLDQGDKWDLVFNTFTLGRDSWWRPLQVDHGDLPFDALAYASDSHDKRSTASMCLNGAVYWIYEKQKMLVAFDVKEETFKALPLPEDYDQVGGCVGVFADMSWKHDKIVLWILNDYQNIVWVKETISLASEREDLGYQRCIEALGTIHTGEFALVHYFIGFFTRI
ncbi:hypothetical protein L3X38_005903 [Prunus dulcis]|uniref:F-box associated beta-propeller type 3 domain-containing protein n=1 Tax=Prunus dulcis TaxID=3755 RepID=A0AAD5F4I6_PRUDU|nr:hypothetical protein L3X38_005903 [Prunus dulcis]